MRQSTMSSRIEALAEHDHSLSHLVVTLWTGSSPWSRLIWVESVRLGRTGGFSDSIRYRLRREKMPIRRESQPMGNWQLARWERDPQDARFFRGSRVMVTRRICDGLRANAAGVIPSARSLRAIHQRQQIVRRVPRPSRS